jgi:hypothetical protein
MRMVRKPRKTPELDRIREIKRHTNAIFTAFKHELEKDPNGKKAAIKQEYKLTIEPLAPDAIVLLKEGDSLDYNIAKAFRRANIIEIKSESESFNLKAFR